MIDLVIVGAGPSALSAAIYAARDGLRVRVFEKEVIGGIISTSELVENYPGFEGGISGIDLGRKMREQAEKFGAIVDYGEVTEIRDLGDRVSMRVDGDYLEARTVLIVNLDCLVRMNLLVVEFIFVLLAMGHFMLGKK